mgnify:CR=1 FL=1|jgi:hypothetical protein
METIITKISSNTSGNRYGSYTDQSVVITQTIGREQRVIILNKKELEELERVIGAKFKA